MKFTCVVDRCYGYRKNLFCYVFNAFDYLLILFYILHLIMDNFIDYIHLVGLT